MDLHTILKPHIGIKMYRTKFSFISDDKSTHVKLKNPEYQFLAPFWNPISAKMKNSLKITSIVWVLKFFIHKKLIYAHAYE